MASSQRQSGLLSRGSLMISMLVLAVIMIFPFVYVLAVSFSSANDVIGGNLIIFPAHPTLEAYRWVIQDSNALAGLEVSTFLAIIGTLLDMVMTVTMAYALSRHHVPGVKIVLWLVMLTLLLSPGIITRYLVVRQVGLIDSLWALIVPGLIAPFNLLVLRQFFMNIPQELIDAARMDGAGHPRILWNIVLPLSKASLAAIALFYAVGHWNNFFDALMYINDPAKYPISIIVRQIVLQGNLPSDAVTVSQSPPPGITIQMAVVVIATIPILLVYPFLQKHFSKGVLTGSIKG